MANLIEENSLCKIRIDGVWLNKEREVRQELVEAFKKLLSNQGEWSAGPMGLEFSRIEVSYLQDQKPPSLRKRSELSSLG